MILQTQIAVTCFNEFFFQVFKSVHRWELRELVYYILWRVEQNALVCFAQHGGAVVGIALKVVPALPLPGEAVHVLGRVREARHRATDRVGRRAGDAGARRPPRAGRAGRAPPRRQRARASTHSRDRYGRGASRWPRPRPGRRGGPPP